MLTIDDDVERLRFIKDAGRVKRMHVNNGPLHCVDEHGYGVAVILIVLHPKPSAALLKAAILHDMPERITGDIPAPVKWMSPEISNALNGLETRIFDAVLGYDPTSGDFLTEQEMQWLKAADSFDLWLTCADYLNQGYRFCRDYMDALEREVLMKKWEQIPTKLYRLWADLKDHPEWWTNATKEISG